jgi:hypothetical protein
VLLKGTTEPLTLQVTKVVYDIAANGRTNMVELQLCRPRRKVAPPDDLVNRYCADLDWPTGTCPPCIWDSVRLRYGETVDLPELRVLNVIHEIDQASKTHGIKVQVLDASPKRVFSDDDIQAALRDDIEPLGLFGGQNDTRG